MVLSRSCSAQLLIADRIANRPDLVHVLGQAGFALQGTPHEQKKLQKLGLLEMDLLLEADVSFLQFTDFFPGIFHMQAWSVLICAEGSSNRPTLLLSRKNLQDASAAPAAMQELLALLQAALRRSLAAADTQVGQASGAAAALSQGSDLARLSSEVAHDLNNFLTIIRGHCQQLLRAPGRPAQDLLAEISQAGEQATLLTQQLHALSSRYLPQASQKAAAAAPAAATPTAATPAAATPNAGAAPPPVAVAATILLVEDESAVRSIFRRILQDHGYFVMEAASGAEAVFLAEQFTYPIHLLVSDVSLPQMTGVELARKLVAIHPESRTLLLSGYADGAMPGDPPPDQGCAFLQKPFKAEMLLAMVREVLAAK